MKLPAQDKTILKETNRKAILNIFRNSEELTIFDLSKKINLSKPTLIEIINYYLKKDLLVIAGKGESTYQGGKRPNIYKLNKDGGYAVGITISTIRVLAIIINLRNEIVDEVSIPVVENEEFDSVFKKIIDAYNYLLQKTKIKTAKIIGLAVGTYGITDYVKGTVLLSPRFPAWNKNIELVKELKEYIPHNIPVCIDNTIRFQVFAEKNLIPGNNVNDIVALYSGNGMAAGVIIGNEIKRGNNSLIGEIGHMVVAPESKERCRCGGRGCFEVMVSPERVLRLVREKYNEYPDSIIFKSISPDQVDIYDVFKAADHGDNLALAIMNEQIEWFVIGISNIILMYDPRLIIIGGVFTQAGNYFLENLRNKINQISLFSIKIETEIKYSVLDYKAGVLGAATFMLVKFFK